MRLSPLKISAEDKIMPHTPKPSLSFLLIHTHIVHTHATVRGESGDKIMAPHTHAARAKLIINNFLI